MSHDSRSKSSYQGPPNTGNLHTLVWIRPDPQVKHRLGTEYALSPDAQFVFERFTDNEGRHHYRRAHWSRIAADMEWADVPQDIWTQVDETGHVVDPQGMEQPK